MLKLNTTYNLENNIEKLDKDTIGSAMVDKLLKGFGVYTHYIESRNLTEGLEAVVRFYIWSHDALVKKLDSLFNEYHKINEFLLESEYYKTLSEENQKKMVSDFNSVYFSIKFLITDIYDVYEVIRKKIEEEKKQKKITEDFINALEKL